MSSLSIALITLGCVFGAALLGLFLSRALPEHHLSEDSRDIVKLMAGLLATLSALVLGLLTASAKDSYDSTNREFRQNAAKVIMLDHALAAYGPPTKDIRVYLRESYQARINQLFPAEASDTASSDARPRRLDIEIVSSRLRELTPPTDEKSAHLTRALQLADDVTQSRWLLAIEYSDSSLPTPMLIVLVCWLAAMFMGFGVFAPRNGTAIAALLVGALAVSSSIFLIEEMSHPLDGIISISGAPMRSAIDYLGR